MPIDPLKKGDGKGKKTLEKNKKGKLILKKRKEKGTFLRILLRRNLFDDKPFKKKRKEKRNFLTNPPSKELV